MARRIPIIVCFVFGLFMLVQFFVPHGLSGAAYETVLDWMQIVFVFTLLVGAVSYAKLEAAEEEEAAREAECKEGLPD